MTSAALVDSLILTIRDEKVLLDANMKLKFMRNSGVELAVCGMAALPYFVNQGITHLISIHDVGYKEDYEMINRVSGMFSNANVVFGFFNDSSDPQNPHAPGREDVSRILDLLGAVTSGCVLIHCAMGISRSTALAYSALCQWTGPGNEVNCLDALMKARSAASPNPVIVSLADDILGREGAMIQAVLSFFYGYSATKAIRA